MSTLYRPVLIETAEQAEALPTGTLARHSEGAGMDHAHKLPSTPVLSRSRWISTAGVVLSASMIGWTALVPIEAEEEAGKTFPPGKPETTHFRVGGPEGVRHLRDGMDVTDEVDAWEATRRTRTRYVTPWEEA